MFPLIKLKRINNIFSDSTPNMYRYTIKNKATIVDTDRGCFVLKEKKGNDINVVYDYLKSRSFEYYPRLIKSDDNYNVYEYIEDAYTPEDQRALDMMHILSLLHNKTTFYKEMDKDEYKEVYEELTKQIDDTESYYTDLINSIERKVYMSPSEYLLARNISKIYGALHYSKSELDNWYELIKSKNKKRLVTLYNNNDISHLIRNKELYLINWENSRIDIPIYDFYNFYKRHALDFDCIDLLNSYEKEYPLLEEEKRLLFIMLSIPESHIPSESEFDSCKNIKNIIDYTYKTERLIFPEEKAGGIE